VRAILPRLRNLVSTMCAIQAAKASKATRPITHKVAKIKRSYGYESSDSDKDEDKNGDDEDEEVRRRRPPLLRSARHKGARLALGRGRFHDLGYPSACTLLSSDGRNVGL
jgi:hypothetical protein